jgi:hypothetical protein
MSCYIRSHYLEAQISRRCVRRDYTNDAALLVPVLSVTGSEARLESDKLLLRRRVAVVCSNAISASSLDEYVWEKERLLPWTT